MTLVLVATSTAWLNVACSDDWDVSNESVNEAALIHRAGWEVSTFQMGTAAVEPFLMEGWGAAEDWGEPVRWALSASSSLRFYVIAQEPEAVTRLRARIAPHGEGQRVGVVLNGHRVGEWPLPAGWSVQEVSLPRRLVRRGENVLEFTHARWDAPSPDGSGDRRRLAVAWSQLELVGAKDGAAPRFDRAGETLTLPAGSEVSFALAPAARHRFSIERSLGAESGANDPAFEIEWLWADGTRRVRAVESGGATTWTERSPRDSRDSIDSSSSAARLTVRATGDSVRLVKPRLATSGPADDAGPSDNAEGRAQAAGTTPAPSGRRPNVLIYLVDTLRADRVGAARGGASLTPSIDALARESFVFENTLAQAPWTKPAVASILTGLLPQQHGAVGRDDALSPDVETLGEILKSAGYRTAAFVANANASAEFGFGQGFDHFVEVYRHDTTTSAAAVQGHFERWHAGLSGEEPFFAFVHVLEPHAPYLPSSSAQARFAADVADPRLGEMDSVYRLSLLQDGPSPEQLRDLERLYDAEVATLDEQFGPWIDGLRASGVLDETIFVFVADHGEEFWEHRALTHGSRLNVEQMKIPFFLRSPVGSFAGRSARWAQQIDILPTLLAMCDVGPSGAAAGVGRDLSPLLRGEGFPEREELFGHLDLDGWKAESVLAPGGKYIRTQTGFWGTGRELYDVAADPHERENLAVRERLRAEWLESRLSTVERLPRTKAGTAVLSDEAASQLRALGYLR